MPFTVEEISEFLRLIPFPALIIDGQGAVAMANDLAGQLLGHPAAGLAGRPVESLTPPRYRDRHARLRADFMNDPQTRPMGIGLNLFALRGDGHEVPVEIALSPLDLAGRLHILAVIHDISPLKHEQERLRRSRQQMRELSARLLSAQEEERTRVARLVHDELGQLLTALKMDLAWLQRRLDHGQELLTEKTRAMSELVDEAVRAVRSLAFELRPGILDDLGLEAAVEWQLEEFEQRTGIPCTLTSNMAEDALDAEVTTCAFRILQQALTNVARHAEAKRVEVVLSNGPTELTLTVRDDGRGINEDDLDAPTSIGLLGMHETAHMQGGRLDIQGIPGRGTTVTLRLPRKPIADGKP